MGHLQRSGVVKGQKRAGYASRIPDWIFHRHVQLLLDALTAAFALIYAYALRFDFHIPVPMRRGMWIWMCVVAIMRPLTLLLLRGYRGTWRFFDIRDGLYLAMRSLPVTVALLLVRAFALKAPVIPYSVLILEFGIFLMFAAVFRVIKCPDNHAHHVLNMDGLEHDVATADQGHDWRAANEIAQALDERGIFAKQH